MARTLLQAFPHVVAYTSIEGWGTHYLASMQPIPTIDAATFIARMPQAASSDLVEWSPGTSPRVVVDRVLAGKVPVSVPSMGPLVTDDRPFNEYYLARTLWGSSP